VDRHFSREAVEARSFAAAAAALEVLEVYEDSIDGLHLQRVTGKQALNPRMFVRGAPGSTRPTWIARAHRAAQILGTPNQPAQTRPLDADQLSHPQHRRGCLGAHRHHGNRTHRNAMHRLDPAPKRPRRRRHLY
jgi:hypothetical protein